MQNIKYCPQCNQAAPNADNEFCPFDGTPLIELQPAQSAAFNQAAPQSEQARPAPADMKLNSVPMTAANPLLMTCPDCGRECSTKAAVCPHCGRPINDKTRRAQEGFGHKALRWIVFLIALFLLFSCGIFMFATSNIHSSDSGTSNSLGSPTPYSTSTPR